MTHACVGQHQPLRRAVAARIRQEFQRRVSVPPDHDIVSGLLDSAFHHLRLILNAAAHDAPSMMEVAPLRAIFIVTA